MKLSHSTESEIQMTDTWTAPAATVCCTIGCDKPATIEWEDDFSSISTGEKYRAHTQGCDDHGPDNDDGS